MHWGSELQNIISDQDLSQHDKIDKALDFGLNFLGLGIGIVSQIDNDVYNVAYASSPGDMIVPGTKLSVGETYCSHTLRANDSVGFHHAAISEIATHPCYSHFKLEAYIGAPISHNGKVIGTVNFSAAAPRDPFTEQEFDFINALASWLGQIQQGR